MAEWKSLTSQEEEIARRMGLDPDKDSLAVSRIGVDQLVFLRHRDREEFYVPLYRRNYQ